MYKVQVIGKFSFVFLTLFRYFLLMFAKIKVKNKMLKISEQKLTKTIIVHRSVDDIFIVINICSVRRKDEKKTKQYNNEES